MRVQDIAEAGQLASQLDAVTSILGYLDLCREQNPPPFGQLMVSGHNDIDGLIVSYQEIQDLCTAKRVAIIARLGKLGVEVK